MKWAICHKSGTVLFTTSDERTMLNRKSHGWIIKMNSISNERERAEPVAYISKADLDAGYPHILARKECSKACPMAVYTAPPAPVVPDVDPSFDAMMRALDAFYADDNVPEVGMLAAFKILLADVIKQ